MNFVLSASLSALSLSLIIYLALVNLTALLIFGFDKLFARAGSRRVRESTLLILAFLGGSVGALLGAKLFRHKTKKSSFMALLGIIFLIQLALLLLVASRPG